ncbi:MAG: hypothetical protein Tsb0017_20200 [Geothermobacteraceae bacterium]
MTATTDLFRDGLLKGLAEDEAEAFISHCRRRTCEDGTRLFEEMTEAQSLFLLTDGRIDLTFRLPSDKGEAVLASRGVGDAVGWSTLVPPYLYRFSGVCRGKTELLQIDRPELLGLIQANYHLGFLLMRNIAVMTGERLVRMQEKVAQLLGNEAVNGW